MAVAISVPSIARPVKCSSHCRKEEKRHLKKGDLNQSAWLKKQYLIGYWSSYLDPDEISPNQRNVTNWLKGQHFSTKADCMTAMGAWNVLHDWLTETSAIGWIPPDERRVQHLCPCPAIDRLRRKGSTMASLFSDSEHTCTWESMQEARGKSFGGDAAMQNSRVTPGMCNCVKH